MMHDGAPASALAGVSHIWVDGTRRREGLARLLLDTARKGIGTGFTVPIERLAFSQPTRAGRRLAAWYSGTEAFLVYG